MWPYYPELLARPVPRYTSFPTAAEFRDAVGSSDHEAALATVVPGAAVSLYLHIPYCEQICWYCGCNTGAANKSARLAAYLDALHAEIDLLAGRISDRVRISRVAFGGGSPNAIDTAAFGRLVAHLNDRFDTGDAVLSVELDPRGYMPEWTDVLARARVTRASLGVQTFNPSVQAKIGRVQPTNLIAEVTKELRSVGIESINFDLMYGLPGQDLPELFDSLDQAIALRPERLAVFGYAHVPHLIPRQKRIDGAELPDQFGRFRQAAFAHHLLVKARYQPVGFDHFALPGDGLAVAAREGRLRRNFQGFTEDRAEVLIGLGASAISQFPGLLTQNEKSAGRYRMRTLAGQFATERGVLRTAEDQARGRIIERLLCHGAADGAARFPAARASLDPFAAAGLIALDEDRLELTDRALPYARAIAACFDPYRQVDPRRFSSAV
ncbi:oxygen-independent coproporphyrinogen III oxidase [Sphingomonas sp. ID1715]|uniref:oxygen-independent coproporphyrinogen III oxidase n=1 Tax=Sphingomonas sp. ID1715 TaxID=1656898 RepID=UPI0014894845|nr:oxygen-independent coproporphyrinogen III oxidase [Sphingomonas sp. ID1715]NNM76438.1 oxygen-independent coproporphyrinogen III oxidase [Sphingomonas sp. ID1715]